MIELEPVGAPNQARFAEALAIAMSEPRKGKGIGTLSEKTLHAALKRYIEPFAQNHETKIGPYVADIVGEDGIIEIQTRSLNKLRPKLSAFLQVAPVTVAYPVERVKYLTWIDPVTGESGSRRKSPKRGKFYDAFFELYKIKMFLADPNIRLRLILLDVEEYRLLNGWGKHRKYRSTRCERIPMGIADDVLIQGAAGYRFLLPDSLPEEFTTLDLAAEAGIHRSLAQVTLGIMYHVGTVIRSGKQGNAYLYRISEQINSFGGNYV